MPDCQRKILLEMEEIGGKVGLKHVKFREDTRLPYQKTEFTLLVLSCLNL
jgi:hypothetical protein